MNPFIVSVGMFICIYFGTYIGYSLALALRLKKEIKMHIKSIFQATIPIGAVYILIDCSKIMLILPLLASILIAFTTVLLEPMLKDYSKHEKKKEQRRLPPRKMSLWTTGHFLFEKIFVIDRLE